ncbi:hypothetical protein CO058_03210 [candidate division WWE3 bacterium CG_4_9_14_0_2_um_filter_35_11]|uniref:Uncharacterized protein n=1 Tax=candidate division WWE3 bacterium CG_4_9_14_0_2_um_filter_35_11 TaxID=1975077 RepID=A0A2M8EL72_UNCKA|nr:MAG: hypothetical protein COV25_03700 [candidate division WWE3 bacterium CG10_big_fil_rev_8_21_14_0_10_35_32]PJC23494.1 MAG: hypothetical protein CO058_03210 [candidate division WWE3 bacterium CG_4_9_14_0_2_um_filter_35_11]
MGLFNRKSKVISEEVPYETLGTSEPVVLKKQVDFFSKQANKALAEEQKTRELIKENGGRTPWGTAYNEVLYAAETEAQCWRHEALGGRNEAYNELQDVENGGKGKV